MSDRIGRHWPIWRLVAVEKVTTLAEVNRDWSLRDIMEANAVLDYTADAQEQARK